MKERGSGTRPTVKVNFGTLMATITRAFGLMIRHTGKACTHLPTARAISVNGKTTCSTDTAKKHGQINHLMKASIIWAASKEEAFTSTRMAQYMMENGKIIRLMELELTPGKTAKFTKDSGKVEI